MTCHWWRSVQRISGPASRRGSTCCLEVVEHVVGRDDGDEEPHGADAAPEAMSASTSSTPHAARAARVSAPGVDGGVPSAAGRAREAGRRGRLDEAVVLDVGAARREVRVSGCLGVAEDRLDARVGALEDGRPLVAGAGAEGVGEQGAQGGPRARVEAVGRGVGEVGQAQQLGVERGLERADREPAAVARLVDVVEGGAGVEEVGAAAVGPEAGRPRGSTTSEERWAVPSTIAASTTCPRPLVRASRRAARTPTTR